MMRALATVSLLLLALSSTSAFVPGTGPLLRQQLHHGVATASRPSAMITSMQLRNGKPVIEVPGHAYGETILVAKTVAVQEAKVETEAAAETKAGITINTKAMGQAPFWAAVIGGLTLFQMVKKKAEGRSMLDNKDVKYIASTEKEENELHIFACEGCGYEMMPARGREGKFFPDDFKCPICGAPKEKFWDMNDPDDPRNQEEEAPKAEAKKEEKPAAKKDEGGSDKKEGDGGKESK